MTWTALPIGPPGISTLIPWRPILDRGSLLQGCERVLNGQQDRRLDGTQRSAGTDRDRRGCHRDVIRSLPQVVCIVIAKGIPETVHLSADRFDVLLGCRSE